MRSITLFALLIILHPHSIAASGSLQARVDSLQAACDVLLQARAVYDSAFGDAAVRTKEYDSFEMLWRAGDPAVPYALQLARSGAPAARVYGLLLLAELDDAAASAEIPRLLQESTSVMVWSGCEGMTQTVGELARLIERGDYVLTTPTGKWSAIERTRLPRRLPN